MKRDVKPIPEGYHTVTPGLVVDREEEAIEFYKRAFGAEELYRMDRPDGKVLHTALKIGDSIIMLSDQCQPHDEHEEKCVRSPEELRGTTIDLFLYVENADEVFERAINAGGKELMEVQDMFWGDRCGMFKDPVGHFWTVATHIEDLSDQQIKQRAEEFMKAYT